MKIKIYNLNEICDLSIEEPVNNIKWLTDTPVLIINGDRIIMDKSIYYIIFNCYIEVNDANTKIISYVLYNDKVDLHDIKIKHDNLKFDIFKPLTYRNIEKLLINYISEEKNTLKNILIEWR